VYEPTKSPKKFYGILIVASLFSMIGVVVALNADIHLNIPNFQSSYTPNFIFCFLGTVTGIEGVGCGKKKKNWLFLLKFNAFSDFILRIRIIFFIIWNSVLPICFWRMLANLWIRWSFNFYDLYTYYCYQSTFLQIKKKILI